MKLSVVGGDIANDRVGTVFYYELCKVFEYSYADESYDYRLEACGQGSLLTGIFYLKHLGIFHKGKYPGIIHLAIKIAMAPGCHL